MPRTIHLTTEPQNCLICFGRVPKYFEYFFPESNVYLGWNQESKDCATGMGGMWTYIVTDNPQASGVQKLIKRFPKWEVCSYEQMTDGSMKYKVLDMNRYIHLYLRRVKDITGTESKLTLSYPNLVREKIVTRQFEVGDLTCHIEFNPLDKIYNLYIHNNKTDKDYKATGDLEKNNLDILTPEEFKNQFEYLWSKMKEQALEK